MTFKKHPYNLGVVLLLTLIFFLTSLPVPGQTITDKYYYRVYFKDKGGNNINNTSLSNLVSQRAIERRKKTGIIQADFRDLPVWQGYLTQIKSAGLTLHCTSKWMNTALFRSLTLVDISSILDLPFVADVKIVKRPGAKSSFSNKLDFAEKADDFTAYDRPITMVNGYALHNSGFIGNNVLIAVLDGGFIDADRISSLGHLRNREGIKYTFDFVNKSEYVYNSSSHGTAVLSILAGKAGGYLAGTATGSDYLLLKTEDVGSEYPCEEDFWAAGAEFADSLGADIISSSVGYYNFDDPALNYKYSDLDGNTAFVTKAADIAASKGILVITSAGNERNKEWKRIIFPSDGDSVLSSAAVQGNNIISAFSSAGPASDGRIKPDISTMGVSVPLQTSTTSVTRGSGTSFSCPVLSGLAACLIQAVPEAGNFDIIEALRVSTDRFYSPDSLYGYGIPDMLVALNKLQEKFIKIPEDTPLAVPNPTTGDFEIIFREPTSKLSIEIFSMNGTMIFRKIIPEFAGRRIIVTELQNHDQGIYLIRSVTDSGTSVQKVIKINY
jgi:serine protease AprX